jgi:N-acetylneuraminic acid mutarotase
VPSAIVGCRRVGLGAAAALAAAAVLTGSARSAGPIVRVSSPGWHLPQPVYRTTATVAQGRIYVLGGHDAAGGSITDVYRLDPRNGRSRKVGSLALQTHGSAAATLAGRILVFGGASTSVHDAVQWFRPWSGRTSVIGHMPRQRADVTAAVVGKRVVLIGGFDGYGPQRDVWATGDGKHFRVVAHLPQPVRYPAVAVRGNDVYVFGGLLTGGEYDGTFTTDIQRIHLPTGSTAIVGHLPTPLAHAMAAVLDGRILVLGGSTGASTSAAILRFDPARNRAFRAGSLPDPLTDAAVGTIGSTAYLLGGAGSNGQPLSTVVRVRLAGDA